MIDVNWIVHSQFAENSTFVEFVERYKGIRNVLQIKWLQKKSVSRRALLCTIYKDLGFCLIAKEKFDI